jgi:mRNA interferase RelE/StbE
MKKPGSDVFRIEYTPDVVKIDIPRIPKRERDLIRRAIESRLTIDPLGYGKPLRYSFLGHRRIRVGDYRVIYRIDGERRVVTVDAIGHRKEIYER